MHYCFLPYPLPDPFDWPYSTLMCFKPGDAKEAKVLLVLCRNVHQKPVVYYTFFHRLYKLCVARTKGSVKWRSSSVGFVFGQEQISMWMLQPTTSLLCSLCVTLAPPGLCTTTSPQRQTPPTCKWSSRCSQIRFYRKTLQLSVCCRCDLFGF